MNFTLMITNSSKPMLAIKQKILFSQLTNNFSNYYLKIEDSYPLVLHCTVNQSTNYIVVAKLYEMITESFLDWPYPIYSNVSSYDFFSVGNDL